MLSKRIVACLDVRDGQVLKGVQFQGLRHAGDPAELARRYNTEGIDEVVVLDISATLESRRALAATIASKSPRAMKLAKESFNGIEPVDLKRSYRFEQGFTFELNLAGVGDELRQDFVEKRDTT